jgi:hypothetical protein
VLKYSGQLYIQFGHGIQTMAESLGKFKITGIEVAAAEGVEWFIQFSLLI